MLRWALPAPESALNSDVNKLSRSLLTQCWQLKLRYLWTCVAQEVVSHPSGRRGLRLSELEDIKFGQRAEHDTNPDREEENLRFQMEISHDSLAEVDSGFKVFVIRCYLNF